MFVIFLSQLFIDFGRWLRFRWSSSALILFFFNYPTMARLRILLHWRLQALLGTRGGIGGQQDGALINFVIL